MGVIVTGMHRSGTSMTAQWVDGLGVPPAPGQPFPVDAANAEGLFEIQEIVALDDKWLGILGGSWWAPPPVREQTWRSIDGVALDQARSQLGSLHELGGRWYVKDPRISLLLPLWDRLTLRRQGVVLAVREHREVAMSLHVRNGTTYRRALALWWAYNDALVRHVFDRNSLVLDFSQSLAEPRPAIEALVDLLGAEGFSVPVDAADGLVGDLRPSRKRQRTEHLDGSAERLAADLDDHLLALQSAHGHKVPDRLPAAPDWVQEALDELTEFWSMVVERDIARSSAASALAASSRAQRPTVGQRLRGSLRRPR